MFNFGSFTVLSTSTFLLVLCGCGSNVDSSTGSSETTDAATGTTGATGTATTASETSSATSTSSEGSSTSGQTETTTTGSGFENCEDAQTPEQCEGTSNRFMGCGWFATTIIADPVACEPSRGGGMCMLADQDDTCTTNEGNVCDGGSEDLFARPLDRGGFELVLEGPTCTDGIGDFIPCDAFYVEEGTALADACACGCSLLL
jgi:hypothetical protein